MKKIILFLGLILSTGCAVSHNQNYFSADLEVTSTNVTWVVVEDADKQCRTFYKLSKTPQRIEACALIVRELDSCFIFTNKTLTQDVLGHEIRHCFQGRWH